jgi:hypothetical protein
MVQILEGFGFFPTDFFRLLLSVVLLHFHLVLQRLLVVYSGNLIVYRNQCGFLSSVCTYGIRFL